MSKLFTENKYKRWYFDLILKARLCGDPVGYYERHHIIPRAMGGSDDADNLVDLTFREHFIAHWLLIKFTQGKAQARLRQALWRMCCVRPNQRRIISAWQYAIGKEQARLAQIGRPKSLEHRKKISQTLLGRKIGPFSEEHKRKLSESNIGQRRSPEAIENNRKAQLKSRPGENRWIHVNSILKRCDTCGGDFSPGMWSRWHGSKCRGYKSDWTRPQNEFRA